MQATIDKHISYLLFDHECVVVPGFGAFLTRYYHAEINPATDMMRPPSKRVSFNKRINENDGLLAKHISRNEGISYSQAMESIAISVRGWKRILRTGKKVNLPGIGRLYLDNESRIQFNPAIDINYDKSSYGLDIFRSPAVQRNAKIRTAIHKAIEREIPAVNPEEKKKREFAVWRWAAVITPLLGLGIAAGIYFNETPVFHNFSGLNPFSLGNFQNSTEETATDLKKEDLSGSSVIKEDSPEEIKSSYPDKGSLSNYTEPVYTDEVSPGTYHIVVGSFKDRINAENYVSELRSKGLDAYIAGGDNHFSRVAVGNFNTHEQANLQLSVIKGEVNSGAWIYAN